MAKIATECKKCQRCVLVEHLDRDGYCCFCGQPAASVPAAVTPAAALVAAQQGDEDGA